VLFPEHQLVPPTCGIFPRGDLDAVGVAGVGASGIVAIAVADVDHLRSLHERSAS